jgi:hypothetical protein
MEMSSQLHTLVASASKSAPVPLDRSCVSPLSVWTWWEGKNGQPTCSLVIILTELSDIKFDEYFNCVHKEVNI